ncbi:MAG: phosphate acyltransferase [bacterium]
MAALPDFDAVRQKAVELAQRNGPLKLVLACAEDPYTLKALREAIDLGLVEPILVGNARKIEWIAAESLVDISNFEMVNEKDNRRAAAEAAVIVSSGRGEILMRGKILAYEILETALHDSVGLRVGKNIWTHVGVFWPRVLGRFLIVTDGGVVIDPNLEVIPDMIANAVQVAKVLGIEQPRVALLAAVETVYTNMPVAMGGAVIAKMADRGQIKDAIVDGPLSLDVALFPEVALEKKVKGEVAGKADILVTNKIEVGNALCKSLFIFGQARSAGLVIGAKQPIVLTSRAESVDAKVNSIALATLLVKR